MNLLKTMVEDYFVSERINIQNYLAIFEETFQSQAIKIRNQCATYYLRQLLNGDEVLNQWIIANPILDAQMKNYVPNV